MHRIKELLDIYHAEYTIKDNTFYLRDYGDVWGVIEVDENFAYFYYSNSMCKVSLNDALLGKYVDKYLLGFDDFVEFVEG